MDGRFDTDSTGMEFPTTALHGADNSYWQRAAVGGFDKSVKSLATW
jgi:hypothetical protein